MTKAQTPASNAVELIRDGDGVAVIGPSSAVERFIASVGLAPADRPATFDRLLRAGSAAVKTGSDIVAESGRWVKLTEKSARDLKAFGFTPTKTPGISHAMVGQPGKIKNWVQIVQTPGTALTNPAMLAGAAGIMAQLAMQQTMAEITDYLITIDAKLDRVLKAQTNEVLARLDGVDLAVREALSVREAVGRVSEVTWSKVQSSAQAIHETQGFALRQLNDLADELEEKSKINELADAAKDAEAEVKKWIVVLARCFELHDAVAVLELDRVLDASPDELDRHRIGLASARRERLELIADRTRLVLDRMDAAVRRANSRVLFNPKQSPAIVASSNQITQEVHDFHAILGIASKDEASEAKRWSEAAAEQLESARETGSRGVEELRRLGGEAAEQAGVLRNKLSTLIADRKPRRS